MKKTLTLEEWREMAERMDSEPEPTAPTKVIDWSNPPAEHNEPTESERISNRRIWLRASLAKAEERQDRATSTHDCGGKGGRMQDDAILAIVRNHPGWTANRIVALLVNGKRAYAALNRLVNTGQIKRRKVGGKLREMELHYPVGWLYDGEIYKSGRELARHPDNAIMHSPPLSHTIIAERLKKGWTPELALLKGRQNDGRGGGRRGRN